MKDARILLAEDEAIVGIEIKNSLQRLGYTHTDLVPKGKEVLEAVDERTPDLVLMDVNLEGTMDGIEATERLHEDYDVPVVFVTAHSSDSVLSRIRDTDAVGYVVKPINDSDLESITRSVIQDGGGEELDRGNFFLDWVRWLDGKLTPSGAFAGS